MVFEVNISLDFEHMTQCSTHWAAPFWCHDAPGRSDFLKLKHIVLRTYGNSPLRKSSGNMAICIFRCQKTSPALTELQHCCPKTRCLAELLRETNVDLVLFSIWLCCGTDSSNICKIRNVTCKQRACQAFPDPVLSFTRFLSPFPNIFYPGWYKRFSAERVCRCRGRSDRMHACVKLLCSSIVSEWQACDAHLMVSLSDVTACIPIQRICWTVWTAVMHYHF